MSNKTPILTQTGIITNNSIILNNTKSSNRSIIGVCQIKITDTSEVLSSNTMNISKQGETGYVSLSGNSQSLVFQPTNSRGTGSNTLSISSNTTTINNTLILKDDIGQSVITQEGETMKITGTVKFDSCVFDSILATNITSDFIGVTGIVAKNITGINITADFIGATGIVANKFYALDNQLIIPPEMTQLTTRAYVDNAVSNASTTIFATTVSCQSILADTITGTNSISSQLVKSTRITGQSVYADTITGATSIATPLMMASRITGQSVYADTITGATSIATPLMMATRITGQSIYADTITTNASIPNNRSIHLC